MKERPILMTPENAQKVFEGTKTQTRRIVKDINPTFLLESPTGQQIHNAMRCPYGEVGDRLWIRESWQEKAWSLTELNRVGFLSAPRNPRETYCNQALYAIHKGGYNRAIGDPGKWKPSIHMPRWACRTVVELTEVRVERLQSITDEDVIAEGVSANTQHLAAFVVLWESINGKGSWALNPWVWVLTIKLVKEVGK